MLPLLGQHCRAARGRLALVAELGDMTKAVRAGLLLVALLLKGRLVGDSSMDAEWAMASTTVALQGLLCWLAGSRLLMPS